MFSTLGIASEALVMRGRSTFEEREDYIIQRSPLEPEYWFGNQIVFRQFPESLDEAQQVFVQAFPDAAHCVFSFDLPDGAVPQWAEDLQGYEVDHTDILVLTGSISGPQLPDGFQFRKITNDADWEQLIELQLQTEVDQGYPVETHRPFIETKFQQIRSRCEKSDFAWFGLFDGEALAADMGITWDDEIARFQSVETRPEYQRKGLCAALLVKVVEQVRLVSPHCRFVIAAAANEGPGRIYRRAGFVHQETIVSLTKEG